MKPGTHLRRAKQYYGRWICMDPERLDRLGFEVVVDPSRDQKLDGYSSPSNVVGVIRNQRAVLALGSSLATGRREAIGDLRRSVAEAAHTKIGPHVLDMILKRAGLPRLTYMFKFFFHAPESSIDTSLVRELRSTDWPLFLEFFIKTRGKQADTGWLRPYFESLCRRRLCFGVVRDGRLLSATDAPSVPYMSDQIVEIGIYTLREFRRKGLAEAVCTTAAQRIVAAGGSPVWSCGIDNRGSRQLALSIGFREFAIMGTTFVSPHSI